MRRLWYTRLMADDAAGSGFRVTLRDVYDSVQEVKETISSLAVTADQVKDHEARIRAVERRVWTLPTFATLISIVAVVAAILAIPH